MLVRSGVMFSQLIIRHHLMLTVDVTAAARGLLLSTPIELTVGDRHLAAWWGTANNRINCHC